jgi:hypothetical protein
MRKYLILCLSLTFCFCGEQGSGVKAVREQKLKSKYVFKEGMVKGGDTAMMHLRASVDAVLAQHWYLDDLTAVSDDKLVWEDGVGARLFPSLNLFADGSVMENPRGNVMIGKWRRELNEKVNSIIVDYSNKHTKSYRIRELSLRNLTISWKDGPDSLWIRYRSDGLAHENMLNDPYHPMNNTWRIAPTRVEDDEEIQVRVKACVRFYALFYRDNIKRHKKVIEFLGLPEIFRWYDGGIGLPMKGGISDSWIACFYNRQQAEKGYEVLNKLLVTNDFDWPLGTPGWHYRTLSVLEQMYAKL